MATPTLARFQTTLTGAFDDSPARDLVFKAMFGGACAYANGRVFASLSNVGLALKTDATTAKLWLEQGGKWLQYEEEGPISKSYVVVPGAVLSNEEELARWVEHSVRFVLSLPQPKARPKKNA